MFTPEPKFNQLPDESLKQGIDKLLDFQTQIELAKKLENVYVLRPNIEEFVGAMAGTKFAAGYTQEAVNNDLRYVHEIQRNIEGNNAQAGEKVENYQENGFALGEMMQAMVIDQINKGWLNEFNAVMTSEFDDLKVGVDSVLKHRNGKYLATSFDFTISSQWEVIQSKLYKMWEQRVETGQLVTVKYFQDPDTHERASIIAPKFIIGGTTKDLQDLANAYLDDNQEALKEHPFQYMIIEQMYEQLVTILNYYEQEKNEKYNFTQDFYEKIYVIVQRLRDGFIREGKINTLDFHEYVRSSKALDAMRSFSAKKKIS
jgi:hypothetical protein